MSEIVKNPFHNKKISPEEHKDNVIGDVVGIVGDTAQFVGKLFGRKGYGQKENVGRIQQHLAIAAAAKAGMSKKEIADVMTQTSPTGTKFSAQDKYLAGKSNEQIMNDSLSRAKKYAAMTGTVLPQDAINQILGGGETVGSGPTLPQATGIDSAFNVLLPLRPAMAKALSLKGIAPAQRIDTLANQFFNNIVVPAYGNNFTGSKQLKELDLFDTPVNHADEVTDAIITGIVAYINNLQEKRNSGADLNKTEQVIVTGTDKATQAITTQAKSGIAEKFGQSILFRGGWVWLILGVIGLIILVVSLRK